MLYFSTQTIWVGFLFASLAIPTGYASVEWDQKPIPRASFFAFQASHFADRDPRWSNPCAPLELERALGRESDARSQAEIVESWRIRCEPEIFPGGTPKARDLLIRLQTIKFSLRERAEIRRLKFRLSGDRQMSAILALKPGADRRPLVVARAGIFGDATEGSAALMSIGPLYDEGPFHVLLLPSVTGRDFVSSSKRLILAGFEEAAIGVEILEELFAFENLGERVSEIHFFGFSLGAHATLYSGLFAREIEGRVGVPVGGVLAACPVVNLAETLESILDGGARGRFYGPLVRDFLWDSRTIIPEIAKELPPKKLQWLNPLLLDWIEQQAFSRTREAASSFPYPPLQGRTYESLGDWKDWNRYSSLSGQNLERTWVLYNRDDDFVLPALNAETLRDHAVTGLQSGSHCAFPAAYGWKAMGALFRGFFQGQSRHPTQNEASVEFLKVFSTLLPFENTAHRDWKILHPWDKVRLRVGDWQATSPLKNWSALGLPARARTREEAARISRYLQSRAYIDYGSAGERIIRVDHRYESAQ